MPLLGLIVGEGFPVDKLKTPTDNITSMTNIKFELIKFP
jgi:hypothetical protein